MSKRYKYFYNACLILTLVVMSFGATYAYFAANARTDESDVAAGSKVFSLNLSVLPKYPSVDEQFYKLIPMKDEYTVKAINNKCKDINEAGVCYAYDIKIYDYSSDLEYVSGKINVETSNITNLSYMLFDSEGNPLKLFEKEETDLEGNVVKTDVYQNKIISGTDLSLGDAGFYVKGQKELNLVLVIWLTDTLEPQNEIDIGTFNGDVTFMAGVGGQISGVISSTIAGTYGG